MIDSFYDEDSTCPKRGSKLAGDWQTKHLQRLHGSWRRGDFLQYRKTIPPPEEQRKGKPGIIGLGFVAGGGAQFVSDAPLLLNGKVPVHQICDNCHSRLVAYARILQGRFTRIVEIESGREEGELLIDSAGVMAKSLREDLARRLSDLQESCKHEGSEWMPFEWAPGHLSGEVRVCTICEKVLENDSNNSPRLLRAKCPIHGILKEESGFCPRCAEEWP